MNGSYIICHTITSIDVKVIGNFLRVPSILTLPKYTTISTATRSPTASSADAIDELSSVVSPVVADKDDKPLFMGGNASAFKLAGSEIKGDVMILNYKK